MKAAWIVSVALAGHMSCAHPSVPTPGTGEQTEPASAANKPTTAGKLCGATILISHVGAQGVRAGVTRTRDEALALAQELAARARSDPGSFTTLARRHSEGPAAPRGGYLGVFGPGQLPPLFIQTVRKLALGGVSAPVTSRFGVHIFRRLPLPKMLAASHILISYSGVPRVKATRTKQQAQQLAHELAQKAQQAPSGFADLARRHSDCPSAPRGGKLGSFARGRMVPAFDKALEQLQVGQISAVVETQFGFHVIRRDTP